MWTSIRKWFKDSESIFLARLTAFVGVVASVLTYVDPSVLEPIIPNGWFPLLLVAYGLAAEYLRRRRDPSL